MAAKVIVVFCAQALFIQAAFSQCLGHAGTGVWGAGALEGAGLATLGWETSGLAAPGWASNGWSGNGCSGNGWAGNTLAVNGLAGNGWTGAGFGVPAIEITATSGGALPVSSTCAIAPIAISVASENVYDGALTVIGDLPFVGTVGLESVLPTAGAGIVNHSCGSCVGIVAESIAPAAAYGVAGAYGPATAAIAPGAGIHGYGGRGCGCGLY